MNEIIETMMDETNLQTMIFVVSSIGKLYQWLKQHKWKRPKRKPRKKLARGKKCDRSKRVMIQYDLTKNDSGHWSLKQRGNERATRVFTDKTKEEAIQDSAYMLKQTPADCSLIIHKEDGTFQEERTYPKSADPSQSPG